MKMLNGIALKKARLAAGLSAQQFAQRMGWRAVATVYLYERGYRKVSADTLYRLAEVLGVEPESLLVEVKGDVL